MIRFIVIILLSFCHFGAVAHDHAAGGQKILQTGYVQYDGNKPEIYIHTSNPGVQNEFVIDIDDDDDSLSDRRSVSPVKTTIAQLHLQLYLDFYQTTFKSQYSCFQSIIIPTDRCITQRVLRI